MRQVVNFVSSRVTVDLEIHPYWVSKTHGVFDYGELVVKCGTIILLDKHWEGLTQVEISVVAS